MMKKIATMTFHWATNYGAVIQAYALQQYLLSIECQTEIINYVPWSVSLQQSINWRRNKQNEMFGKEKKLEEFRKRYLLRTEKIIRSKTLSKYSDEYSAIICGSDQIWNEAFTLKGEFKPTLAYYLNFAGKNTKRIAYAVSFGTIRTTEAYDNLVRNEIDKFSEISVRETTGQTIVNSYGLKAEVVCDPTLLLNKEDYLKLIKGTSIKTTKVFDYVLHGHTKTRKVADYIIDQKNGSTIDYSTDGIQEWLCRINEAEIVVTNSFHGVMLSLILNRPFIAVLINGSGMNDRLITILNEVGLENRILYDFDENIINAICTSTIDWDIVNEKLDTLRNKGKQFLKDAINECE